MRIKELFQESVASQRKVMDIMDANFPRIRENESLYHPVLKKIRKAYEHEMRRLRRILDDEDARWYIDMSSLNKLPREKSLP